MAPNKKNRSAKSLIKDKHVRKNLKMPTFQCRGNLIINWCEFLAMATPRGIHHDCHGEDVCKHMQSFLNVNARLAKLIPIFTIYKFASNAHNTEKKSPSHFPSFTVSSKLLVVSTCTSALTNRQTKWFDQKRN